MSRSPSRVGGRPIPHSGPRARWNDGACERYANLNTKRAAEQAIVDRVLRPPIAEPVKK
jgi:hypothetical protein